MSLDLALDLPRDLSAAARARLAVRRRLTGAVEPELLGRLQLVVTELVTNALVHGEGGIRLDVRTDGGRVRGEVVDGGGGLEGAVRRQGHEAVGGRGLQIVDALTARWGIHDGTTHVWFELEPGDGPARSGPELGDHRRPGALEG